MMSVAFADSGCGQTLFVVHGRMLPYRIFEVNVVRATQSLAYCLPKGSDITIREDVAGVDKFSFERWERDSGEECLSRTAHGQKFFLLYDGHRIHMS